MELQASVDSGQEWCSGAPSDSAADRLVALLDPSGAHPEVGEIAAVLHGALTSALETGQAALLDDALRFAQLRLEVLDRTDVAVSQVADALEDAVAPGLVVDERDRVRSLLARCLGNPTSSSPDEAGLGLSSRAYVQLLLDGDRQGAVALSRRCVSDGMDLDDILLDVLEPAMREVGRRWALGHLSIAQEHFCTAVTQYVMTDLYPGFVQGRESQRRLVAVHVPGSTHHLGLRMVADVLESRDWSTNYIVDDVPARSLPDVVAEDHADLLLISATLSSHVTEVTAMIRAVRADPRTRDVKVVVGGRPFIIAPDLVDAVGADGWARDARSAADVCNALVEGDRATR